MPNSKTKWIALIRAIGPATHKKMSMQQLRESSESAGLSEVKTLLATGNLLFCSSENREKLQRKLATIVEAHNLDNEVFLRLPDDLERILKAKPLPDAAAERPNHLLVHFLERKPQPDEIAALQDHPGPERIEAGECEIFIDYVDGVARSKLTPSLLERRLGQKGTARNWNTVQKLFDALSVI